MPAKYTVTALNQFQRIGTDGHLEDWADAIFTLDDYPAQGTVEVAMTGDWQDALSTAIQAQADELEAFMASQ